MGKKKKFESAYFDYDKGFVPLSKPLLNSSAWQIKLSFSAKLAYINILSAFWSSKDKDPKNIVCTINQLVNPMHKNTWTKATKELESMGFIVVVRRTGISHGQFPNIYQLSNKWKRGNNDKTIH